jgi:hypothetical protein
MSDQLLVHPPVGQDRPPSVGPGFDALALLRGNSSRRPQVDPGLSGGLREWLEDGVCSLNLDPGDPLVVTKQALRSALAGRGANRTARQLVSAAMALGTLVDALFRQFVTIGHIDDPMRDALDAIGIDQRHTEVFDFVRALEGRELVEFRDELETQTAILVSKWPRLSLTWLPRTQDRIAVPLAGGGALLVGIIDLVIGVPSAGRASIGLVEVKSGRARPEDREDLRYYALLETLRSGAPPFRVATFYTRTGQIDAEDVDDDLLAASVQRVIAAIVKMAEAR